MESANWSLRNGLLVFTGYFQSLQENVARCRSAPTGAANLALLSKDAPTNRVLELRIML